jgi:hypothetical protein
MRQWLSEEVSWTLQRSWREVYFPGPRTHLTSALRILSDEYFRTEVYASAIDTTEKGADSNPTTRKGNEEYTRNLLKL